MIAPPLPAGEADRLADLQALELLDTPPEERFDRIVRLAMGLFDVPIAYIALIDADRQWFKAKCGLSPEHTGRDESFCGHTILQDDMLVVPDARTDPRFHDNPLVVGEPFIRFYAGHPLAGRSGGNVGTLCLADSRPRQLSKHEATLLRELAGVAEREIGLVDLARLQRQLLDTKAKLEATQRRLNRELADADAYVRSLLPPPLDAPGIAVRHRFLTCSELGGDMLVALPLGDGRRTVLAVLDVAGHGVGSSLLSATAAVALRPGGLGEADLGSPAAALAALNRAFPLDRTDGKFMTAWYGVYDSSSRSLTFASAGHHPALLVPPAGPSQQLGDPGPLVGFFPDASYGEQTLIIPPGSLLYLFSDGAFEVADAAGSLLGYDGFAEFVAQEVCRSPATGPGSADDRLDGIVAAVTRHAAGPLTDDFALLEARLS